MDKDLKEALQVAKELTAKLIETRTVTPANFAEVFPSVLKVVSEALSEESKKSSDLKDNQVKPKP